VRKQRRLSSPAAKVLSLFVDSPGREIYGLQVMSEAGIPSGSLYPILHLLERIEVIVGTWEDVETAAEEGHRPRKKYKLNPDQAERAQDLISEAKTAQKALARNLEPRTA
jgi:PadR family transcriptional regulator PadR